MRRIRPISHDDRLTVVDHLDELRARIVVAALAFTVAFGLCAWQNELILEIVNRPLPDDVPEPITFGVTEPFTTTFTNAAYAAILLSLPVILYEVYAFVLPAFSPGERRLALPLMLMVPALFIAGAAFGYFVVLERAVQFLQNFNDDNFDILLQAQDYYRFSILLLIVMGLLFQIPVGILGATRMGIVSIAQLRANRRYALLVIAVLAMLLPGTDPVTMLLLMAPLVVLYEGSILFAALLDRRSERLRETEEDDFGDDDGRGGAD